MYNPEQLFTVKSITRKRISEKLNEQIDTTQTPPFTPDDQRLGPEFCERFAATVANIDQRCQRTDTEAWVAELVVRELKNYNSLNVPFIADPLPAVFDPGQILPPSGPHIGDNFGEH